MFKNGTGANGLAVIVDARTKQDREDGGCLDTSRWRHFLGAAEWKRTLRIALRDYATEPLRSKALPAIKAEVDCVLAQHNIRVLLVMQTSATVGVRQVHSAWNLYGHAGSPYKWSGTVFQSQGLYICPVLNPANYEDVYEYLIRRWFVQAYALACGRIAPMPFPELLLTTPSPEMVAALTALREDTRTPIAIDIETNTGGTIITAIGLSNGTFTVSVPWDGFPISGTDAYEPALSSYSDGRRINELVHEVLGAVTPKILHNGAFDVYELSKRGIVINNFKYDTLLLHRVAFPQYRHGLQAACASLFCISPWKCIWKPPSAVRGTGADVWLSDPIEMRKYNCRDAYATVRLYEALREKVGLA